MDFKDKNREFNEQRVHEESWLVLTNRPSNLSNSM